MQKGENKFKDKVCRMFEKLCYNRPIKIIKHNDFSNVGIPDVQVVNYPRCIFMEIKYVEGKLSRAGLVLKHEFSAKQISYLQQILMTKQMALGVVGIEETNEMFIIPAAFVQRNFTYSELQTFLRIDLKDMNNWVKVISNLLEGYIYSGGEKHAA